jgi:periplasmic protein TonB
MKFKRLNRTFQLLIAGAGCSLIMASCNNADESANNSTSAKEDSAANANKKDNTEVKAAKKKTGKVSSSMAADNSAVKMEKDKMGIYNRTEVAPAYNGGQSSLEDYITRNLEYPADAIDNNVEGVVNVQFAVDEKGNVSNVSTIGNKLGYGLEEAAIKVVSNMPKWTPGQVKGKNVKTWRTLPINYRLES